MNISDVEPLYGGKRWGRTAAIPLYSAAPSNEGKAKRLGCTCDWWGGGSIVRFDEFCPVLGRHIGAPVRGPRNTGREFGRWNPFPSVPEQFEEEFGREALRYWGLLRYPTSLDAFNSAIREVWTNDSLISQMNEQQGLLNIVRAEQQGVLHGVRNDMRRQFWTGRPLPVEAFWGWRTWTKYWRPRQTWCTMRRRVSNAWSCLFADYPDWTDPYS